MSDAKPYSDEEIERIRFELPRMVHPSPFDYRWLATVDALRARVEAVEAERDRAKAALVETLAHENSVCLGDLHATVTGYGDYYVYRIAATPRVEGDRFATATLAIDALLAVAKGE